jgi:hypothetical protein
MQSMSFDPAVANIGAQVVDDAIQGLQAGVTVSTSVTGLAPAGADEVSAQAAMAFAAAGAQIRTLNTASQEELMRTGGAFSEIARRYAETDAALAGRLGDVLSLPGHPLAGQGHASARRKSTAARVANFLQTSPSRARY